MRLVGIYLLSLFFLLLGGHENAQATAHAYKVFYSPAQSIGKGQQAEQLTTNQEYFVTTIVDLVDESVDLFSDDDEGDENLFKKRILLAKTFLAFSYAFILNYSYHSSEDTLPICEHLSTINSHKYIVQRVLRI
ncbi:hypothetical protein OCK74_16475 [Chitinophagaceae bacterium LB-8]|uniref:Uncharacterized protein n=1 Tax=Paraflavisolibacter caeni TaxID=2982496 RepID=A0A9X3B8G9_9BACT|nr:hypothetical protein [Paraflavisolibacter caeni]MCU7550715.1 hypothetical protein [Paraflavisolibacter caeni]